MEKHFALIGNPIAHSLSPIMHRAGFLAAGIEAEYQKFQVSPEELGHAVKGLTALGFAGWNVTVPYKEAIIPFLNDLTEEARRAGAVNTVKVSEGRLFGHNTDGGGFVRSIREHIELRSGLKVVLLGAGGAARGIAMALAEFGVELYIMNRTAQRAEELVILIKQEGGEAQTLPWGTGDWLKHADCVVQTTSIGIRNETFPFSLAGISSRTSVVDIIFNPWETDFLAQAQRKGCKILNGIEMLLHQGALAWEFWLDRQAPLEAMREALYKSVRS